MKLNNLAFCLSIVISFNSINAQVDKFPFTENFDETELIQGRQLLPEGWRQENTNKDLAFWEIIEDDSPNVYTYSFPNAIHMSYNPVEAADDWLFTPMFEMIAGNEYDMSFWYKKADTGFGTSEKLEIRVGEKQKACSMQSEILFKNESVNNAGYKQGTARYVPTKSGNYCFGFHCYSDAFQFLLIVDDIRINKNVKTGVRRIYEENELQLFPNPAENQVFLTIIDAEIFPKNPVVHIYSISGRLMNELSIQSNTDPIDVSDLPNGWYIIQLSDNYQRIGQTRLLINR